MSAHHWHTGLPSWSISDCGTIPTPSSPQLARMFRRAHAKSHLSPGQHPCRLSTATRESI
eukprot:scaffold12816_cov64-Phaeocystis_antarctica.AAC.6